MSSSASTPENETVARLGKVGLFDGAFRSGTTELEPETFSAIERLGYSTIWVPNANPDLHAMEQIVTATTVACVATAVVSVWDTTPEQLARQFQRIPEAGARAILGVGISHAPLIEAAGRAFDRPLQRIADFLDELQHGPDGIDAAQIMVGANGPKALTLSAERAAGAVPYLVTPEHTAMARELLGNRVLAPVQKVILDDDPARARALARRRLRVYWGLPNYRRNLERLGFDAGDFDGGGSDRIIDSLVAWGESDAIARRIMDHHDAGADHVAVHLLRDTDADAQPGWTELAEVLELTRP